MKHICLVGAAILLAACSSHRVRCGSALRPVNKPVAAAKPVAAVKPTVPGSTAAAPGPAAGEPQSLPVVPRP
jgi:hypothetical protein